MESSFGSSVIKTVLFYYFWDINCNVVDYISLATNLALETWDEEVLDAQLLEKLYFSLIWLKIRALAVF